MSTARVSLPIVLLSLLACVPWARAGDEAKEPEPPRRPMLWVLEGETPVYLFGTIHLPDPRVSEPMDVVTKAFDASDVFYAEVAMEPGALAALQQLMYLPGKPWLDEQVGAETWKRVEEAMAGGPLPPAYLKRMKPWVVGMHLLQKAMAPEPPHEAGEQEGDEGGEEGGDDEGGEESAPPEEAMDVVLYRNAAAAGKVTGGLETMKEQVDVFDSMTPEEQIEMLKEFLDVVEGQEAGVSGEEGEDGGKSAKADEFTKTFEGMIRAYRTGDAKDLAALVRASVEKGGPTVKRFMKKLFDDRNVKMADRILAAREKYPGKTIFVAVGAGHFPGGNGILALLEAKGLKVRRLEADSVIPAKAEAASGTK